MNYEQKLNDWFAKFEHRMHSSVPKIIAETAVAHFQDSFKKQAWMGVPWQPLSPKYAARKGRGRGLILTASGILQRSIRPSHISADKVTISAGSTKAPYARVHNEGLRVIGSRTVRTFTNRNFMGKGKPVQIRAHSRNVNFLMPKRQFMGHSRYLNQLITTRLTTELNTK